MKTSFFIRLTGAQENVLMLPKTMEVEQKVHIICLYAFVYQQAVQPD